MFERYVNFEFYKTTELYGFEKGTFERYVNFEFYKTKDRLYYKLNVFERYVNFEFYKTLVTLLTYPPGLRDM